MGNRKKLTCSKCKTTLIKVRDFIKQSGYQYYFECPKCDNMVETANLSNSGDAPSSVAKGSE